MTEFKPDWVANPIETIADLIVERMTNGHILNWTDEERLIIKGIVQDGMAIDEKAAEVLYNVFNVVPIFWICLRDNHNEFLKREEEVENEAHTKI